MSPLNYDAPLTLIGGAPITADLLEIARAQAPRVIAADGGADQALDFGVMPERVIGDFDSISDQTIARIPAERLCRIREQDSTDFEKCLQRIEAPLILGVGFSDGRFDHQLATCNVLCRYPRSRCVIIGQHDVLALVPPRLTLDLPAGARVSLFPMEPVRGTSEGLVWPIDGLELSPGGRIGTSNRANGPVTLNVEAPRLILILSRQELDPLLRGLTAAPHWPEP